MSTILPFNVRKSVKELIEKSNQLATNVDDNNYILYLQAKGKYSDFFFKINDYELIDKTTMCYDINYYPYSKIENIPLVNRIETDGLYKSFDIWYQIISEHFSLDIDNKSNELKLDTTPVLTVKNIEPKVQRKKRNVPVKSKSENKAITNNYYGDIKNSQINQDLDLRGSSLINTNNINNSPAKNDTEQSIIHWAMDIFRKYWWGFAIPLILLIISYLIEYKSGFFIKSNP